MSDQIQQEEEPTIGLMIQIPLRNLPKLAESILVGSAYTGMEDAKELSQIMLEVHRMALSGQTTEGELITAPQMTLN